MRRLAFAVTVFYGIALYAGPAPDGRSIVKKVIDRDDGKDSIAQIDMLLTDRTGYTEARAMTAAAKDYGTLSKSLIRFTDPANIRLIPDLGGGALYDAGSYAVSLIRIVAGKRPLRAHAIAQFDEKGVDRTTIAHLEFDGGLLAQVSCSFATVFHRHASIGGDQGVIETNYLNHPPMGGPAVLQIRRGTANTIPMEPVAVPDGNGFRLEAESFAALLRDGDTAWTGATPVESVDILATMDAMRASAKSGKWESLAA